MPNPYLSETFFRIELSLSVFELCCHKMLQSRWIILYEKRQLTGQAQTAFFLTLLHVWLLGPQQYTWEETTYRTSADCIFPDIITRVAAGSFALVGVAWLSCIEWERNKGRGVTISLWRGGQGHTTPSLFPTTPPTPSNTLTHKQFQLQLHDDAFCAFSTRAWQLERDGPMDRRTNGPMDGQSLL